MKTNSLSTRIWEQHSDKLSDFICRKVSGEDSCHDILQEVFLKIIEKEDRIKLIERPSSYIIKMAQNAVNDHFRARKKQGLQSLIEEAVNEEHIPDLQLADCCLMAFIKKLPLDYSEALILSELKGLSQKQLSENLGISYSGAKSRVQRARKMLKEAILACCPYQFDKYGNIISCCG